MRKKSLSHQLVWWMFIVTIVLQTMSGDCAILYFLKGALIGDGIQEPKIYIKRTMTEKGTSRFSMSWYVYVCVCMQTAEWNISVQVLCVYTVNVYACRFIYYLYNMCMYVFNV